MQTLVAVYPTRAEAVDVKEKLVTAGVPAASVALSPEDTTLSTAPVESSSTGGFWDWLFGSSVPDTDRELYTSTLREGRTAVSVQLADDSRRAAIEGLMHEHGAMDYFPESAAVAGDTAVARSAAAAPATAVPPVGAKTTAVPPVGAKTTSTERVPLVKEQLEVGKRLTEERYRVRVYPVERRVQESVNLRDETVVVEHRPTGAYTPTEKDLAPREFEVVERHETPLATKRVVATEEVVVHKDVRERTETVSDTVRETKVDVDKRPTVR